MIKKSMILPVAAAACMVPFGHILASEHQNGAVATEAVVAAAHHLPPLWLVVPFVILLLMIATGPLFYHRFWEHHYPKAAMGLGAVVAVYYGFMMDHGTHTLLHTLEEYISFIALVASLFIVSGGILIHIERRGDAAAQWSSAPVRRGACRHYRYYRSFHAAHPSFYAHQ